MKIIIAVLVLVVLGFSINALNTGVDSHRVTGIDTLRGIQIAPPQAEDPSCIKGDSHCFALRHNAEFQDASKYPESKIPASDTKKPNPRAGTLNHDDSVNQQ